MLHLWTKPNGSAGQLSVAVCDVCRLSAAVQSHEKEQHIRELGAKLRGLGCTHAKEGRRV